MALPSGETGGKKGVSRNSATPASGYLRAPKGSHHEVLRAHMPHMGSLFLLPHPPSGHCGDRGPGNFCLWEALAQKWERARRWQSVGWKGQSVGFLPLRFSMFCLPWAEKPPDAPACLALQHQLGPESTRKVAAWSERPLVAIVQMIVTRQKRVCLESGGRGLPGPPRQCLSWPCTPVGPVTTLSKPLPSANMPAQGLTQEWPGSLENLPPCGPALLCLGRRE